MPEMPPLKARLLPGVTFSIARLESLRNRKTGTAGDSLFDAIIDQLVDHLRSELESVCQ